jgi:PhnB protein
VNAYLSPYLNFGGDCAEAMAFYQSVLGGKLEMMTFGDAPMDTPPEQKDLVMHSTLQNDTLSFMASDAMPDSDRVVGTNIALSIAGSDEAQITAFFEALSQGGTVDHPLKKEFWGDSFGMLTDKFGVHWMFNIGEH